MLHFDSSKPRLALQPGYGFRDRQSEKKFCDGKLRAEGRTFDVHKCVVGIASEFLGRMFTCEVFDEFIWLSSRTMRNRRFF